MFSKQSSERFDKDTLHPAPAATPGPGSYGLPSAMEGTRSAPEVSERWSDGSVNDCEKLDQHFSPQSPPCRTPTPNPKREEKENRVPLSARGAATPKVAQPGTSLTNLSIQESDTRRQRDLRLASKLDMVRDELKQKSKEAKELQVALTAKDRKIEDLSKKIEELAADRREAHRRTLEAENEVGTKRRQVHEKDQELAALQRKLEHARIARKEWTKHAEKREEEQRGVQNEMLKMQQSVETLREKLASSERDQHMAEQTLRQQQRHSSELEAGFQAHIEVLEEQIARERTRRKELEERQAKEASERAHDEATLKSSRFLCEELKGKVLELEAQLKNKVALERSWKEQEAKLEEELQRLKLEAEERQAREAAARERGEAALKTSETRLEEVQGKVLELELELKGKLSSEMSSNEQRSKLEEEVQQLKLEAEALTQSLRSSEASREGSDEEVSSLKAQRAAMEDELRRFGEVQHLQLQQKAEESDQQIKALREDLAGERHRNQAMEKKVADLEAQCAQSTLETERRERLRVQEVEKQLKELREDLADERQRNEVLEQKKLDLEEKERSCRATLENERQERIRDTEICDLEARALRAEAEAEESRQMLERWKEWGDEQQLRELAAETERLERLKQVREEVSEQVEAARKELVAENRALQKRIAELESHPETAQAPPAAPAQVESENLPKSQKVSRSLFEVQRNQLQSRCSEMENHAKAAEKKLAELQLEMSRQR